MKIMARKIQLPLMAITLLCLPALVWAAPAKIAILPFQIHAQKDYDFLRKGIVQMLGSRLSQAVTAEVVDAASTDQAVSAAKGVTGDGLALQVGRSLQADFIVSGSVTLLGESVSIDAKVQDLSGARPPMTFYKQTQGMDSVIPQINALAEEINTRYFGRQATPAAPPAAATPAPGPAPATPALLPPTDIHAHPDKLMQEGRLGEPVPTTEPAAPRSPLNPAFVPTRGSAAGTAQFWKSANFKYLINGMDVGDVNNDGILETVLVTPDEIHIYQFYQGRRRVIKKIDTGSFNYNIGVDVADINGNGTPEIFVSSFNNRRAMLNSQVIEFDGGNYNPIVAKAKWYFRVQQLNDGRRMLLGQGQRTGGADPLTSPIVELVWKGADYIADRQVLPGGKANLLGVAFGDIRNDKTQTVLGFTAEDRLRFFERSGNEIWTSSEYYGGSPVSFLLPPDNPGGIEQSFFLPTRIRAIDLDGDQKVEVIVPQNIDTTDRKLAEQRFYNDALICSLAWDGLGMAQIWCTKKISGRIQDLAVADFDNDGRLELLAAVVSKEGATIITKPQSTLIAYELSAGEVK